MLELAATIPVPPGRQLKIPAKTGTKLRIIARETEFVREVIRLKYEYQTAAGESIQEVMLALADEDGSTAYSDWLNSDKSPEERDQAALKAAGIL